MIFYPLFRSQIAFWSAEELQNGLSWPFEAPCRKWVKNEIFHDFFKLHLNVLRCYPRYVEMFLGPLLYFWKLGPLLQKWRIFQKCPKIKKSVELQNLVTFFLIEQSKKRKYESDAKFYEVFEINIVVPRKWHVPQNWSTTTLLLIWPFWVS